MARIRTDGVVAHYHHPRYKSAPGEIAARVYPDLAEPNDLAVADWRRQAFSNDLEWADRVVRGEADVREDQPLPQPRRQTSDAQKAYALWGREQEREADAAAREDIRQRWHDFYMESSIFQRKAR
jgi:hypothetical protein